MTSSIGQRCFTIVRDYPTKGTTMYNMAPLLASAPLRKRVTAELAARCEGLAPTLIVALETRGYFVGSWLADALGLPLVPLRKTASALKLYPRDYALNILEYDTEYKKGESIALPENCIPRGSRVLIVDDVLATGGTARAAEELVHITQPDSTIVGAAVLLDVLGLFLTNTSPLEHAPVVRLFAALADKTTIVDIAASKENDDTDGIIHPMDKRAVLMWHPSMASLARELLVTMRHQLRASPIKWEFFPDGWPNVRFESRATLQHRDVVFLASFHDKALIMEQISLMIAVPRQVIKSLRVFIPYYGPGTMERVSVEGELATAETLAKMSTACLPSTMGGPPIITIFDIHALPERFFFDDSATVTLETAIPLIKKKVIAVRGTVVFPDEGAFKRYYLEFKGVCPMLVCGKVRGEGDARTVVIAHEFLEHSYGPGIDPFKQPAFIVDDLVRSGSTLAECAVVLRAKYSFPSINAFVTHAVFSDNAHLRFVLGAGKKIFDTFYVTNTNPSVAQKLKAIGAPFKVLDIVPLLKDVLDPVLPEVIPALLEQTWITLCSKSPLKYTALLRAIAAMGNIDIISPSAFETTGTVNQPIGNAQIVQCVIERLRQGVSEYGDNRVLYVAIESGIVLVKADTWQEVTCIAASNASDVFTDDFAPRLSWVYGPVLDAPHYAPLLEQVLAAKGEVTLGELLHAQDPSVPADAWYNRKQLITEGLVAFFKKNHF